MGKTEANLYECHRRKRQYDGNIDVREIDYTV